MRTAEREIRKSETISRGGGRRDYEKVRRVKKINQKLAAETISRLTHFTLPIETLKHTPSNFQLVLLWAREFVCRTVCVKMALFRGRHAGDHGRTGGLGVHCDSQPCGFSYSERCARSPGATLGRVSQCPAQCASECALRRC